MLRNCVSDWKAATVVGVVSAAVLATVYPLTQENNQDHFTSLPPPGPVSVFWNCGFLTHSLPDSASPTLASSSTATSASEGGIWWESPEAAAWHDGSARWIRLEATGPWLHARSWGPASGTEASAAVLLVHGYAEHSSRPGYDEFARYLVRELGVRVYTFDNRGFGLSQGERAFAVSYEEWVHDAKRVFELMAPKTVPRFVIGHSLGGAMALCLAMECEHKPTGVVLTGPAIVPDPEIASPLLVSISSAFSWAVPKLVLPGAGALDPEAVCRDPEVVIHIRNDPLYYHSSMKARTGAECLRMMSHIRDHLQQITFPFLTCHGMDDRVTLMEGSQLLYDGAASSDRAIKLYQGLYHELLNEPEKEQVSSDIASWIKERLP
mmetsp:Transcript_36861/g.92389  ORF Transcript_36861/g.92389 Transcript_36861/m.92389 type:complete len:379 (-) Transcript_36861:580-1716(-)|eukprot:CAMPEP_0177634600 /NCGR_PEP_ID=MMETSP0447-20121125/3454_1 /TAXON_ID=0 /ORGANISM="Stygamoeba regulata, Strain BSH-02190019" /LENGTH=378 /DNA_ID=CAMNT_0019136331 /DNA_START=47 /DNA_END=1183 /DNA_ORIENTATION=+